MFVRVSQRVPRWLHHFAQNTRRSFCTTQRFRHVGVCIDVDGVLQRGQSVLPHAREALMKLQDGCGNFRVPVTFVTNSVGNDTRKADYLSRLLDMECTAGQVVQAHGPLSLYTHFHDKHCLVLGQGRFHQLAQNIGFRNTCVLSDIRDAFPELDVVDHRSKFSLPEVIPRKPLKPIEAIICLGEPIEWESALQISTDVLLTYGHLDQPADLEATLPQLPVLVCNMDLYFMHYAHIPRYGHGAFLTCLEALYKKHTGQELMYTALLGKPSEITFRFAEHKLHLEAQRLGMKEPIKKMYMIGDNPDVDIVGANLYKQHLARKHQDESRGTNQADYTDPALPASRQVPPGVSLTNQTVEEVEALLVSTGVYSQDSPTSPSVDTRSHKDFHVTSKLLQPNAVFDHVGSAIEYILEKEKL